MDGNAKNQKHDSLNNLHLCYACNCSYNRPENKISICCLAFIVVANLHATSFLEDLWKIDHTLQSHVSPTCTNHSSHHKQHQNCYSTMKTSGHPRRPWSSHVKHVSGCIIMPLYAREPVPLSCNSIFHPHKAMVEYPSVHDDRAKIDRDHGAM